MINQSKEKPLDNIITDGGFCAIFRRIACIGDSLSSGEFESVLPNGEKRYYDFYEYSWGQYIARTCGNTVLNFSRGGMTVREYCDSFADINDFWNKNLKCQAYIIALGANDIKAEAELGSIDDVDFNDWHNNKKTFTGLYASIIQRYREIEPKSHMFLISMPRGNQYDFSFNEKIDRHKEILTELADRFKNCWILDLRTYGEVYDDSFCSKYFLGGHMNPCGYLYTSRVIISYIDYIIRHNMESFNEVGFIGTPYKYHMIAEE